MSSSRTPSDPRPRAALITFGCKVNQAESAAMAEQLTRLGYRVEFGFPEAPVELAVINTCVVTGKAEGQSRRAVRRVHRIAPHAAIVVAGCYAELRTPEIARLPGVRRILGNVEKLRLADHLASSEEPLCRTGGISRVRGCADAEPSVYRNRTRAFLKIQDGCESRCSYCVVPLTRGPCRSLPPDAVLARLHALAAAGTREVVLTGIHLGYYGKDLAPPSTLLQLLEWIASEEPVPRIRISSLEPHEVSGDLIRLIREADCLAPHFHLPLQSGDASILRAMNRPYSPETYARVVEKIKAVLPGAAVGADVIVGFPGESEIQFRNTVELVERIPLSYLHVFPYSRRTGTPAARRTDQVPPSEKKRRSRILMDLGKAKRNAFHRSWVGGTARLLVEDRRDPVSGMLKGYTDEYVCVHVEEADELRNRLVSVRIARMEKERLLGRLLDRGLSGSRVESD